MLTNIYSPFVMSLASSSEKNCVHECLHCSGLIYCTEIYFLLRDFQLALKAQLRGLKKGYRLIGIPGTEARIILR